MGIALLGLWTLDSGPFFSVAVSSSQLSLISGRRSGLRVAGEVSAFILSVFLSSALCVFRLQYLLLLYCAYWPTR